MGLTLNFYVGIFCLLAFWVPLLEAACICNGYITERGQGECKTTYKVARSISVKGILHQKNFYCLNLIFWDFEAGRSGVSRGGEVGFRELLSALSFPAVPRGPIWGFEGRRRRNPTSPCLETPPAVPRNPTFAAPRNPWGQNLGPKFSSLGGF